MTQNTLDAQYQQLCREFESAREALNQAIAPVNQKFLLIAQRTSHINPTDDELSKLEVANRVFEDIICRMRQFVKVHTGAT